VLIDLLTCEPHYHRQCYTRNNGSQTSRTAKGSVTSVKQRLIHNKKCVQGKAHRNLPPGHTPEFRLLTSMLNNIPNAVSHCPCLHLHHVACVCLECLPLHPASANNCILPNPAYVHSYPCRCIQTTMCAFADPCILCLFVQLLGNRITC
jgi:hypothetical protein